MTAQEQIKFDEIVARFGFTAEQIKEVEAFISDVSDEAYQRGIDAESYNNACTY